MPRKKTPRKHSLESLSKTDQGSLVLHGLPKHFLIAAIVLLVGFIVYMISPFLVPIIIAGIIASVAAPLQKFWVWLFKGHCKWIAALLSTLIVLIIILGPFSLLVALLSEDAVEAVEFVEHQIEEYEIEDIHLLPGMIRDSKIGEYLDKIEQNSPITRQDLVEAVSSATSTVGSFVVSQTTNVAKKVSVILVDLFILLLSLFYFLRDGDKIIKYAKSILPLPNNYQKVLFKQLSTISKAIIFGIFGAAIMQGAVAGVGYWIAGAENAVFWGTITAFFSIVPYLGAALIWVPITIVFLVTGHWIAALFLIVWGVAVVSTVDNIVKPYLIGGTAHIYPLLTLFVILGSLFTIGFKGLILGPFALILALTFLHIYKLEYKEVLKK